MPKISYYIWCPNQQPLPAWYTLAVNPNIAPKNYMVPQNYSRLLMDGLCKIYLPYYLISAGVYKKYSFPAVSHNILFLGS